MRDNYATLQLVCFAMLPIVVIELLFLPFSLAHAHLQHWWVPVAQLALTGFFLPLYLASLGSRFLRHGTPKLIVLGVAAVMALLAVFLSYFDWGISSGHFWSPDPGTYHLYVFITILALVVSLGPLTLIRIGVESGA